MATASTHLSYLRLRRLIGICGLALPLSTIILTGEVLPSISHYFYTTANILFVSILSILGVFLLSYYGYKKEEELVSDNVATTIGGIAILLVVIIPTNYISTDFPNTWNYSQACPTFYCTAEGSILWKIHLISAGIFFLSMSYLSIFNFTKSSNSKANKFYKFCGYGIIAIIIITAIVELILKLSTPEYFIFIIECLMLLLFAASWLVKGKMLRSGS
jgi:heme A synthase